jgi:hypothetical protein
MHIFCKFLLFIVNVYNIHFMPRAKILTKAVAAKPEVSAPLIPKPSMGRDHLMRSKESVQFRVFCKHFVTQNILR